MTLRYRLMASSFDIVIIRVTQGTYFYCGSVPGLSSGLLHILVEYIEYQQQLTIDKHLGGLPSMAPEGTDAYNPSLISVPFLS